MTTHVGLTNDDGLMDSPFTDMRSGNTVQPRLSAHLISADSVLLAANDFFRVMKFACCTWKDCIENIFVCS